MVCHEPFWHTSPSVVYGTLIVDTRHHCILLSVVGAIGHIAPGLRSQFLFHVWPFLCTESYPVVLLLKVYLQHPAWTASASPPRHQHWGSARQNIHIEAKCTSSAGSGFINAIWLPASAFVIALASQSVFQSLLLGSLSPDKVVAFVTSISLWEGPLSQWNLPQIYPLKILYPRVIGGPSSLSSSL